MIFLPPAAAVVEIGVAAWLPPTGEFVLLELSCQRKTKCTNSNSLVPLSFDAATLPKHDRPIPVDVWSVGISVRGIPDI